MNATTLKKLINLADAHQKADEYISGQYEWTGKACAIGCTMRDAAKIGLIDEDVEPRDHVALAKASGMPELAWRLCDQVFEGLKANEQKAWTPRFLRAIVPNANYKTLADRIALRMAEADAARSQTDAAWRQWWKWCAEMLISEMANPQ